MGRSISFICNDEIQHAAVNPGMTILDYLRKVKKLKGTKEGCREGDCGACTVLIGEQQKEAGCQIRYHSANSCITPVGILSGKHLVTIEGLNSMELTEIQQNFIQEGASQCGFCTPGFIISLTGYFLSHKEYNFSDAVDSVAGNICRCTGYASIKRAIEHLLLSMNTGINSGSRIESLVKGKIIPEYFLTIPDRLSELNSTFTEIPDSNANDNEFLIAGGTDLLVRDWEKILEAEITIIPRIKSNENLIEIKDGKCAIDSSACITDIIDSPVLNKIIPGVKDYLSLFGSLPVRNRATIGGNIVNASPIADSVIFFLPFNPEITLNDGTSEHTLCLSDFFEGYKILNKKKNEIIKSLWFDLPEENFQFSFEKVSRRTHLDIASVNSAIYLETDNSIINEIRISAGGVAPYPVLLKRTAEFLKKKEINFKNISEAVNIMQSEIFPISDVRGSARYKRLLLRQLIYAHFIKLCPQLIELEEAAI